MRLRFGIALLSCTLAVAAACSSADPAPASSNEGTNVAGLSGDTYTRQSDGDLGLNPCAAVLCPTQTTCEVVDGDAVCTPLAPASCAAVLCLEGTTCEEQDGQAVCVPIENPCNLTDCRSGLVCEVQNGEAVCVPPGGGSELTCASVLCIVGTVCEETDDGPQCVRAGEFCGGFAGFPCEGNQECIDDPTDDCDPQNGGADCGGICVPAAPKQFCGGIAGIECPGAGTCVDDASDDCDPNNGGADCGGVCECSGALVLCAPGTLFDESPDVCACVEQPVNDPCAAVRCRAGTHCEADDGVAACVTDAECKKH